MKTLKQEKEDTDTKVEEAKATSKRLLAEKNQLKSEMEQREQKSATIIEKIRQGLLYYLDEKFSNHIPVLGRYIFLSLIPKYSWGLYR